MDSLNLIISQTDTILHRFTLTGFLLENDEPGIVYHSIGVNGASVPSYLSCPNFERDLSLIRPDMVIFAIGINDAIPQNFSKNNFKKIMINVWLFGNNVVSLQSEILSMPYRRKFSGS